MKFLSLFAAGALATSAITRRAETSVGIESILASIEAIKNATASLTVLINDYSGPTDAGGILVGVGDTVAVIKEGTAEVEASPPLNITEATDLIQPVTELKSAVSDSINGTIAKRPLFDQVGLGLEVKIQLEKIQAASVPFSSALVALVPESLSSTAEMLAQPIIDDLQRGVDFYANATNIYYGSAASSSALPHAGIVAAVAAGLAVFAI